VSGTLMPVAAPVSLPLPPGSARPFLKWAGSKKQLIAAYREFYPPANLIGTYHEPFLGGGAVFFSLCGNLSGKAILRDNNPELVTTFNAVRDRLDEVIAGLREHARKHNEAYFYEVRDLRPEDLPDDAARAARFIYLNKTCFNGLYRVNSRGKFNVPIGRYAKPSILDAENLARASRALGGTMIKEGHFSEVLREAKPGDFVYLDPPYAPVTSTAYFTAYTKGDFGPEDQGQLAWVYRELAERGCRVMLSNSDAVLVRELYCRYLIEDVQARRSINSKSDRRGPVTEVVVLNYEPATGALRARYNTSSKDRANDAKSGKRATSASR
jgi:DNA adenine methylase